MIRLLTGTLCVMLLGTATVLGQSNNTVSFSGSSTDFNSAEGDVGGDDTDYYMTFDSSTLFFGSFRTNGSTHNAYDHFTIYIDTDPQFNQDGEGNGTTTGVSWDNNTPSLPFKADYRIVIRRNNLGESFFSFFDGSNWNTDNANDKGFTQWADDDGLEVAVPMSDIGNPDAVYVVMYMSYNGGFFGTSDAGYPVNISGSTVTGFNGIIPLKEAITPLTIQNKKGTAITGSEGWRIFSTPTSDNTYDDLLGNLWTQGITTGADVTNGDANVKTYNGSSFATVNDLTATMSPGVGFITYIYSDDDYDGNAEGFPKTLSLSGTENTGSVSPALTSGADAWTLVGNPYASTIDWDELSKTELTGTVYVYDHSYGTPTDSEDDVAASGSAGSYRVWNGSTGSLTDGLIAPFQGFWVQNSASATSEALTIEEADQTTGGTFYKASEQQVSIKLRGVMNNMMSEAFLSFTENGEIAKDNFDGLKLSPLDFRPYLSVASVTGGTKLDINNLPVSFEGELAIPVSVQGYTTDTEHGTWIEMGGEVTLSWPALTNIPEAWGMTLTDLETGVLVDMKNSESYSFEIINSGKSKAGPSMTILNPQPPQVERMAKGNETPRFTITVIANTTTSTEPADTPEGFALEQNYPNPFNPTTSIQYSVGKTGEVELAIYNVMGQQVETLVSGTKSAGTYRASWDASGMASGIYYYRLQSAGQVLTRQMTLIK